jgi:hypothetical protein
MKIIRKQISKLDFIGGDRLHFKVLLEQSIDNVGLGTDMPYGSNQLFRYNNGNNIEIEFQNDYDSIGDYYKSAGIIRTATDSKLSFVKSYDASEPYKENFDIRKEGYNNYIGNFINGVDRVTNINGDEITYTVGASKDINIGTSGQTTGILFIDYPNDGLELTDDVNPQETITKAQYFGEGWNQTNISIDPIVQYEYLLGVISPPEVESDVFIERTSISVLERHLRLSEIESLDHLVRYGNGYYNMKRN